VKKEKLYLRHENEATYVMAKGDFIVTKIYTEPDGWLVNPGVPEEFVEDTRKCFKCEGC